MKRRWFQIHLSTAVLITFVFSASIGANLSALRHGKSCPGRWDGKNFMTTFENYGFLLIAAAKTIDVGDSFTDSTLQFHWRNVALNVVAVLLELVVLYLLAESFIGRREVRKP